MTLPEMARPKSRQLATRFLRRLAGALLIFFGVGLLTNNVVIRGYAQTGIEGSWGTVSCIEFHTWPLLPVTIADQGEYLGKNVAATDIQVVDVQSHDEVAINVSGSYPSYGVQCDLHYRVDSVFSIIPSTTITPVSGLNGCRETTSSRMNCNELTAIFTQGQNGCIGPNIEVTNRLVFHVEQPAAEGSTVVFRVRQTPLQCVDPGTPPPAVIGGSPFFPPPAVSSGFVLPPSPAAIAEPGAQAPSTPSFTSEVLSARTEASPPLISEVAGIKVGNNGDGGLLNTRPARRHAIGVFSVLIGALLASPAAMLLHRRRSSS